jgi:hypothetical protein
LVFDISDTCHNPSWEVRGEKMHVARKGINIKRQVKEREKKKYKNFITILSKSFSNKFYNYL